MVVDVGGSGLTIDWRVVLLAWMVMALVPVELVPVLGVLVVEAVVGGVGSRRRRFFVIHVLDCPPPLPRLNFRK